MANQIEVEIRGPLTEKQYQRLSKLLRKQGQLIDERDQMVIFFEVAKDNLSLKKDHQQEKIVLKLGNWHKGSRKEVEVYLKPGEFNHALELFKGLGFTKGYPCPAWREDFKYQGVQISLKTRCVIGPHWEMEGTVKTKQQATQLEKKLLNLAEQLGLKVWNEDEYRQHTHDKWQAHHPGPQDL